MVEDRFAVADSLKEKWVLRAASILRGWAMAGVLLAGALWAASLHHSPGTPAGIAGQETSGRPAVGFGSSWAIRSSWTFYIVGSEEEAAALRDVLEQGNNLRNGLGLDSILERVLVATDRGHAQLIVEQLNEGNTILAAFGAADQVVNLVG